jgi:3-deoxy-manno-octulosonate cytidylyltransferase (CMP-KDO synthetase)
MSHHDSALPVCLVVIPARLNSSRLPKKMLLNETGKPLIQHTYEAAAQAVRPDGLCVATDDEQIADVVRSFGGDVVMTSPDARSGTDRVAEVAAARPHVHIFVNVQGDEPEMPAEAIDRVIQLLIERPTVPMSTIATAIRDRNQLDNPACVKVVCDEAGRALYFSRSCIPHPRDWDDRLLTEVRGRFLQHLGIYAYRRDFLLQLAAMPETPLERIEKLEQLRVLARGYTIQVGHVERSSSGIDTPEDYRAVVERCARRRARQAA